MSNTKNKLEQAFKKHSLVLVLLLLVVTFSIVSPSFLTKNNFMNLINQNTHILLISVGLSFVLMSGTVDLSVGYQISSIGVLTSMLMVTKNFHPLIAMLVGIAFGASLGFLNGIVAVKLKIEPIIVTIATTTIFQGISYLISRGSSFTNLPATFRLLTQGSFLGLGFDVWLAIVSVALASFIFNYTYYGRYIKAMGDNPEATRLAGVNINFVRVTTFMISGAFVALATFVIVSKQGTFNSSVGPGLEITGLTAAIIGGISFSSGEGKMSGLVIGVFILAIIQNGMQLAGWNQYLQYIIKGIVLLAAIGFDIYQKIAKVSDAKENEEIGEESNGIS